MKILKRAGRQQPTKLQKRVASISTPELIMWAENALFVIGKELTHHQKDRNIDALSEAEMGELFKVLCLTKKMGISEGELPGFRSRPRPL